MEWFSCCSAYRFKNSNKVHRLSVTLVLHLRLLQNNLITALTNETFARCTKLLYLYVSVTRLIPHIFCAIATAWFLHLIPFLGICEEWRYLLSVCFYDFIRMHTLNILSGGERIYGLPQRIQTTRHKHSMCSTPLFSSP